LNRSVELRDGKYARAPPWVYCNVSHYHLVEKILEKGREKDNKMWNNNKKCDKKKIYINGEGKFKMESKWVKECLQKRKKQKRSVVTKKCTSTAVSWVVKITM
jgi:hypothetical protein